MADQCNLLSESQDDGDGIKDEIELLERRLREARSHLKARGGAPSSAAIEDEMKAKKDGEVGQRLETAGPSASSTHFLLLLADSALPIGSFAFSSGLESYAAHTARSNISSSASTSGGPSFSTFLPLSLSSYASTTLPFVLAAHRQPLALAELDDQLDAATVCTVGRRASVAQGRALLGVWERSIRPALGSTGAAAAAESEALRSLGDFSAWLRRESRAEIPLASAHLGPLFGAICAVVGLDARQTAYVFLLSHVKALVSAAVRANMFGPYQAQKLLAGEDVQRMIHALIEREWDTPVEEAGQSVPVMDLWIGRHETLYSRIFNS